MKKSVKLLLQGGALTLLTVTTLNAHAQHLPNYGFNDWKTACDKTEAFGSGSLSSPKTGEMRQRPGVEPQNWNGSSINQKVMVEAKKELVFNNDNTVKLMNQFVGAGSLGSTAPGYITFGTPWVYAGTPVDNCDGGTYGGVNFGSYKPYGLKFKVKRDDTNDEESIIKAYLWTGTYTSLVGTKDLKTNATRTNCDRAILGGSLSNASDKISQTGQLIARLDTTISNSCTNWTEFFVLFKYFDNDKSEISPSQVIYNDNVKMPTMMNVIICAGNYENRAKLIDQTTLYVDDVDFVYPTEEHQGKIVAVDLALDEAGSDDPNASAWYDATLTVEDWGNIVDQTDDKKGNYSSEGRVTLHSTLGDDVVLDNVKITHHDDYIWLEHSTASTTLEGSLHKNGTKSVYYDVNPTAAANEIHTTAVDQTKPYRVKFVDTASANTTGIEEIDGEAVKAIIFGGHGYVSVSGVDGVVALYSLTGALISETRVDGEAVIAAPAGITIVAYPGGAVKTTVK